MRRFSHRSHNNLLGTASRGAIGAQSQTLDSLGQLGGASNSTAYVNEHAACRNRHGIGKPSVV